MPKKTKYRKQQKGRNRGKSSRGSNLAFGIVGLKAMDLGRINSRQIESCRITINRHLNRTGKVWIRIFPDKPLTKKPLETRMGKGKGSVEEWVMNIKPGRILFEITGVSLELAKGALTRASHKLSFKTKIIALEQQDEIY